MTRRTGSTRCPICDTVAMSRGSLCERCRHMMRHARTDRQLLVRIGAALTTDRCVPHGLGKSSHPDGYALVNFNGTRMTVSRAIAFTLHGEPPPGWQAAHECGDAQCIVGSHIRFKAPAENLADRARHGTANNYRPHVNPRVAAVVGRMANTHLIGQDQLAEQAGVSQRSVRRWARQARAA